MSAAGAAGCRSAGPAAPVVARDRLRAQQVNDAGLALLASGQCAEAQAAFEAALAADPYYGPAHSNLGVALLQQQRFYEAGWSLRHAAQLMPRASQPRANLGILFEAVGRYGVAEEELRKALALAPEDIEIIGHLARVHVRQGRCTNETLAWLETVATQDDDAAWRAWARQQLTRTTNHESRR